jgi:membrane protein required for colicin V production
LENINIFDTITLALIVFLGLKGLFRGFIKEVFALVGIIGGIFIASRIASEVGGSVDSFLKIENEATILLIGFILSLVVFWILSYSLGVLFSKMVSLSGLGIMDKILGVVFGAGKVFCIFAVIFYSLSKVDAIKNQITTKIGNSIMYPIFIETGSMIIKMDTSMLNSKKPQQTVDDKIDNKSNESIEDFK